jgi:hypothetical protein
VDAAGGKEDLLGNSGFAGVYVGDEPYVADFVYGEGILHDSGHWE